MTQHIGAPPDGDADPLGLDALPPPGQNAPQTDESSASPGASRDRSEGYGAGYGQVLGDDWHVTDYLRVLHKRRWTAITVFVLVFGFVILYTFTATPAYTARAQVLIENRNPNVVNFEEVLQQNQRANEYYQTQYRLLESRTLVRRTIDSANLWKHPMLVASGQSSGIPRNPLVWIDRAIGAVKGLVAPTKPKEVPEATETLEQARVIDRFLGGLTINPIRPSQLVDLVYSSPDPAFAALAANAHAKAYIEQSVDFRYAASREASGFLTEQIEEQRKKLQDSQLAIQKYREETDSVSLEDRQNIVVQSLTELSAAVTRARTERIQKQTNYEQLRSLQNDSAAIDTVPAVLGNSFIQGLKSQLSQLQRQQAELADKLAEKHPDMIKIETSIRETDQKLKTEIAKIVQGLRNDFEAAERQERSLTAALNRQEADALALNRQSIPYDVLQRDALSNQQIFDNLLQRSRQTDISGELRSSNIAIVDLAEVPRQPSSPRTRSNLLLGLFGGAFMGVALAFFFEYFDNRIKSPEEIKTKLGLPFLGIVPVIDARALSGAPLVNDAVPHQFAEAFRTIRTNVLFAFAETGSKSIAVTSTRVGEGKTLVSSNLATAMAMAGQRTLLIDADMRRAKIHEAFSLTQEPGLSNVLVGNAKASEAVRRTAVPNLWVLPAGRHPPNPAELLGSRRFKDFMTSLSAHFDWVVVDSPPVLAVTDATVVAHVASGVVFVVGAEMTGRGAAKAALDLLDAAKTTHVGAVLNKVDLHRQSYYYSQYYRQEYSKYYTSA
jgi:capsular exopolysaccharide synthesis family protein